MTVALEDCNIPVKANENINASQGFIPTVPIDFLNKSVLTIATADDERIFNEKKIIPIERIIKNILIQLVLFVRIQPKTPININKIKYSVNANDDWKETINDVVAVPMLAPNKKAIATFKLINLAASKPIISATKIHRMIVLMLL
ncbi:hypothetical protein NWP96_06355 [Mycoplasmopsis cynos]|nr:hypothetical protein [Mycoplasmopsis cynos]